MKIVIIIQKYNYVSSYFLKSNPTSLLFYMSFLIPNNVFMLLSYALSRCTDIFILWLIELLKISSVFHREHAAELGNVVPTKPILFLKPTTSYVTQGHNIKVHRHSYRLLVV